MRITLFLDSKNFIVNLNYLIISLIRKLKAGPQSQWESMAQALMCWVTALDIIIGVMILVHLLPKDAVMRVAKS